MSASPESPPDAELLIATGCPHCPVVLEGLAGLIKEGVIGRLTVTNIVVRPERARELGVRSVPWLQLGPFVLQGLHSPAELREWAGRAGSMDGMRQYLHDQLKEGNLEAMETLLAQQPRWLPALVPLLEDEDTDLKVRIGVDALLESLAGGVDLSPLIPELERLSRHERSSLRADATHYLSLTGSPEAVPFIQARLQDDDEEVRTIAKEAMQEIEAG